MSPLCTYVQSFFIFGFFIFGGWHVWDLPASEILDLASLNLAGGHLGFLPTCEIIDLAGEGDWEGGTPPSPNHQTHIWKVDVLVSKSCGPFSWNEAINSHATSILSTHMRNRVFGKLIFGGGTAQKCRECEIYYLEILYLAGGIFKNALRNLKIVI